jgi:hypothetical protein
LVERLHGMQEVREFDSPRLHQRNPADARNYDGREGRGDESAVVLELACWSCPSTTSAASRDSSCRSGGQDSGSKTACRATPSVSAISHSALARTRSGSVASGRARFTSPATLSREPQPLPTKPAINSLVRARRSASIALSTDGRKAREMARRSVACRAGRSTQGRRSSSRRKRDRARTWTTRSRCRVGRRRRRHPGTASSATPAPSCGARGIGRGAGARLRRILLKGL